MVEAKGQGRRWLVPSKEPRRILGFGVPQAFDLDWVGLGWALGLWDAARDGSIPA